MLPKYLIWVTILLAPRPTIRLSSQEAEMTQTTDRTRLSVNRPLQKSILVAEARGMTRLLALRDLLRDAPRRSLLVVIFAVSLSLSVLGRSAEAAPIAFTGLVSSQNTSVPQLVGTIAGVAGESIEISFLGIGGDADIGSGDVLFRAVGGGLDFTWVAGQGLTAATHRLAPTPVAIGGPTASARGFSFLSVNYTAAVGASVDIFWLGSFDFDGRYTFGTDLLGNSYNDSGIPSSIRPWLQYERVSDVPEPALLLIIGSGGLLARLGRRKVRNS
jgi:hypothetical protein